MLSRLLHTAVELVQLSKASFWSYPMIHSFTHSYFSTKSESKNISECWIMNDFYFPFMLVVQICHSGQM